jgi:hypothetical protein
MAVSHRGSGFFPDGINFGYVSFGFDYEYDLNKVMKRLHPDKCDRLDIVMTGYANTIEVNSVTLMNPRDFLDQDKVPAPVTDAEQLKAQSREQQALERKQHKKQRDLERKQRELEQKQREEQRKQLNSKSISGPALENNLSINCKSNGDVVVNLNQTHNITASIGGFSYEQLKAAGISDEGLERMGIKPTKTENYPELGGRNFGTQNGFDVDFVVSRVMTNTQRNDFIKKWDARGPLLFDQQISAVGFPASLTINGYMIERDPRGEYIVLDPLF